MWVHLCDTINGAANVGKIAGINSFSAYFSDTVVHWRSNFDITHFTPQVQINQMVTDTGNWVLLRDTFVAQGGERYMCIGNFKTDAQTQWQLVDSINTLPAVAYYFYDDVSLIDLDDTSKVGGIAVVAMNDERLAVYPNPATNELSVIGHQFSVKALEVYDVIGQWQISRAAIPPYQGGKGDLVIEVAALPSGIYFIKATDLQGNVSNTKFVKQ